MGTGLDVLCHSQSHCNGFEDAQRNGEVDLAWMMVLD